MTTDEGKLGAFADANRAATPSEPSPETVSGIAGIPLREELRRLRSVRVFNELACSLSELTEDELDYLRHTGEAKLLSRLLNGDTQ